MLRVLFDMVPNFEIDEVKSMTPSELLNNDKYFEHLCGFFNWFLISMDRRYKNSVNKYICLYTNNYNYFRPQWYPGHGCFYFLLKAFSNGKRRDASQLRNKGKVYKIYMNIKQINPQFNLMKMQSRILFIKVCTIIGFTIIMTIGKIEESEEEEEEEETDPFKIHIKSMIVQKWEDIKTYSKEKVGIGMQNNTFLKELQKELGMFLIK